MTDTDPSNVLQAASAPWEEAPLAAKLVPLVQIMLGVIARCQDALLQEDAETLHVIRGTLAHLTGPQHALSATGEPWPIIQSGLNGLLDHVLDSPEQAHALKALLGPGATATMAGAPAAWRNLGHHEELARWFHRLATALHDTHPRAVEMLRLRFSGLGSREIADRLRLPFRLVHRVLGNIRSRARRLEACEEPAA
jgi:hypothetical protein